MIIRSSYIEYIQKFIGAPVIKIITGMRRVGKSTILIQLRDQMINNGIPAENFVHLNMELFQNEHLRTASALYHYIKVKLDPQEGKRFIFIDEVQEVLEWERVVQSLLAENYGEIILTGSNAHMLSSELATLLTGRFIEIPIFGLSLAEFIEFRKVTFPSSTPASSFLEFVQFGGLPGIHQLPLQEDTTTPYLSGVLDTLILRDIVQRHKIRDVSVLERILNFCMDSTGSLISIKRIADYFKSQGLKIGLETVSQYLQHLCAATILLPVSRYDIQGKRHMEYLDKYYLSDIGLRYARLGYSIKRLPGTLETIVLHELLRRGWIVSVGVLGSAEIDFVARKKEDRIYIQVAAYLTEESTIEREFGNLEAIKDNFPKIVLSIDELPVGGRNGILWYHLRDWLLAKW